MTEAVIAVDIGTTSLKAGLITAGGEVVSFYKASFSAPQSRFVAESWLWALKVAIGKLHKENVSIVAISISGNGPTLVSEKGLTLRWNENIEKIIASEKEVPVTRSLFIPRIRAFKKLFPEEYNKSKYIFSGPEYLIWKITDFPVTVLPEERYKSAYWTDEELAKFDLSAKKMPSYVSIGEKCGEVSNDSANFLGITPGIPVFSGGPDFIAALIGTNTLKPGKLFDRSGSSEGFNYCSQKEIRTSGIRTLPSVIPGLWNLSVLLTKSSTLKEAERLEQVALSINKLKSVVVENGMEFPSEMFVTGGQTRNKSYMKKKSERLCIKLLVGRCSDSELVGDACAAWFGLGKYKSLQEAAEKLV